MKWVYSLRDFFFFNCFVKIRVDLSSIVSLKKVLLFVLYNGNYVRDVKENLK